MKKYQTHRLLLSTLRKNCSFLLSICYCNARKPNTVSFLGVLFTAGSKDNLVKAFNIRKNKIENIGKIVIPFGLGSGSCLACIEKTLFVSTEKNVILSVSLESKPISNVSSSLPSKTFANAQITPRHLCFSGSTFKQFGQIQNNTDENEGKNHGIFTSWSRHEVARGFVNGVRCVKPIKQLHVKLRHRTGLRKDLVRFALFV